MTISKHKRPSICYAVPGHNLIQEAGPTRNVLSVAKALSQWADVTVAFRKVLQPVKGAPYEIIELDPDGSAPENPVGDGAIAGHGLHDFLRYLKTLRNFAHQTSAQYDVVLEKSWILSGYLTSAYRKENVPAILVENIVRMWNDPVTNLNRLKRYLHHHYAQFMIGRYLQKIPAIIAETDELKNAILSRWKVSPDIIHVVDLGVDSELFRPLDKTLARKDLKIQGSAKVMLYVGMMDECHDVGPVVEAMHESTDTALELHLVGNGPLAETYKKMAARNTDRVVFHGRVPHQQVPLYIAAADLCLAPYNLDFFPDGEVAYSILKVHEYLSCSRPVASVPSSRLQKLLRQEKTGFLIDNTFDSWQNFIRNFPSQEKLSSMEQAVRNEYRHPGWDKTAENYFQVCLQVLAERKEPELLSEANHS